MPDSRTKCRPATFSTPLIAPILQHRKLRTRRLFSSHLWVSDTPDRWKYHGLDDDGAFEFEDLQPEITPWITPWLSPFGQVGDHLWVREEHYRYGKWEAIPGKTTANGRQKYQFVATTTEARYSDNPPAHLARRSEIGWNKRLARFMPRELCRTVLEITHIGAERLLDITEEEAVLEGVESVIADLARFGARARGMQLYRDYSRLDNSLTDYPCNGFDNARDSFLTLWDSLHQEPGTTSADNPWVQVVGFNVHSHKASCNQ